MKIALLGTGLIGGSVGLAAQRADPTVEVVAFDRDPATAIAGVACGAASRAADSLAGAVRDADFVFICAPVGAIADVALAIRGDLAPGAIVTDVGSTKARLVASITAGLPAGATFIGGHPMAGSEEEGIAAARADLFDGAWWILTPTQDSEAPAYQRLLGLLGGFGARVMALHPAEHDELMAVISHLPQLVATSLMNLAAEEGRDHAGLLALAAGGFRDVTRLAASNPAIWIDICRENGPAIAAVLRRFAGELTDFSQILEQGDEAAIEAALVAGRAARRSLPGKGVAADPYEVRFPIPDRPGVLAEVTTSVGNLGINIEDLQITHVAEGGRGVLHLLVNGAVDAGRVEAVLAARDFDVKVIQL